MTARDTSVDLVMRAVGIAKVYGGKPAALEIRGAAVKALTEKSSTAPPVAAE